MFLLPLALAICAAGLLVTAMVFERRMHRHRQPGVSYGMATFRRDGGWRRADLFTERGLRMQERAARFGVAGTGTLLVALVVWAILQR